MVVTQVASFLLSFYVSRAVVKKNLVLSVPAAGKTAVTSAFVVVTVLLFHSSHHVLATLAATCT